MLGAATTQLKAGKLRALAVTPSQRVAALPDVPTIAEATRSAYEFQSWGGFMAPAGTPDEVVERLAKSIAQAARSEAFAKYLLNTGGELDLVTPPAEFRKRLASAIDTERRIVQRLGLKDNS